MAKPAKKPDPVCAHCARPESEHRMVTLDDREGVFGLLCPTSLFKEA